MDVVHLRRVDMPPGIVAEGDQLVDLDSQLAELVALRDEGKIGAIGLSHVTLDQLEAASDAGVVSVQNLYSAIARDDEPLLDRCRDLGIVWSPYFPLGSGFAGRERVTDQPAVVDAAKRLGVTPAQVGLAWLLRHAPNVVLIPGTTSIDHLEQNLAVGDVHLDDEAVAAIDGLASRAD